MKKKPSPVVIVFDRKEIKQLYNQGISTNTVYIFKLNLGQLQKYEGCRKCNCSSVLWIFNKIKLYGVKTILL